MAKPLKIDGSLPLSGTKDACEQKQRSGFQLVDIKFNTEIDEGVVFEINEARFKKALSVNILDVLTFVPAADSDKMEDIKKKAPGSEVIKDTKIFVKNHIKRVVVFGKKST